MKIAVATLGNFHAKPFGTELQVNQMLKKMVIYRNSTIVFHVRAGPPAVGAQLVVKERGSNCT